MTPGHRIKKDENLEGERLPEADFFSPTKIACQHQICRDCCRRVTPTSSGRAFRGSCA